MTGTLDEISLAIGGLQSEVKGIGHTVDRILDEVKDTNTTAAAALAAHIAQNENTFEALRKDIDELKAFRNSLYGIAAAIGVAASALWQYVSKKLGLL